MIAYVYQPDITYIYTPIHTYWMYNGYKKLGWESRLQRDRDRGHVSNVPDTLIRLLGVPL